MTMNGWVRTVNPPVWPAGDSARTTPTRPAPGGSARPSAAHRPIAAAPHPPPRAATARPRPARRDRPPPRPPAPRDAGGGVVGRPPEGGEEADGTAGPGGTRRRDGEGSRRAETARHGNLAGDRDRHPVVSEHGAHHPSREMVRARCEIGSLTGD